MQDECKAILAGYRRVLKKSFLTNCELDAAKATVFELSSLENLDASEVLRNIEKLIDELLAWKRSMKESEHNQLRLQAQELEKQVQKLEAEARTHHRTQHQLKLSIEKLQNRVAELTLNSNAEGNSTEHGLSLQKAGIRKDALVQKLLTENEQFKDTVQRQQVEVRKLQEELTSLKDLKKENEKPAKVNSIKLDCTVLRMSRDRWNRVRLSDLPRRSPSPYVTTKDFLNSLRCATQKRNGSELRSRKRAPSR